MCFHAQIGDKGVPDFPHSSIRHGINTPPVSMATILGSRLLTKEESKKRTLEVELMVRERSIIITVL